MTVSWMRLLGRLMMHVGLGLRSVGPAVDGVFRLTHRVESLARGVAHLSAARKLMLSAPTALMLSAATPVSCFQ